MKTRIALAGVLLVAMSSVLVACGGTEDGKVTTEKTTVISTTAAATTGIMSEMSSIGENVSDGLSKSMSEAGSELRSGITRMYQ